jgi:hypothetical protein
MISSPILSPPFLALAVAVRVGSRQTLNLAGGQFKFGEAEVVRRRADPGKQPITARLGGGLASG